VTPALPEDLKIDLSVTPDIVQTQNIVNQAPTSQTEEQVKEEDVPVVIPAQTGDSAEPVFISTGKKDFFINNTSLPAPTRIYQISYARRDGQKPQVEILTTGPVTPEKGVLKSPRRVVLDFPETILDTPMNILQIARPEASKIRFAQFTTKDARVVIETEHKTFLEIKNDRVIVRFTTDGEPAIKQEEDNAQTPVAKPVASTAANPLKGKKIAVMAGHGGTDPGAVGARETLEKDMTLDTARRLAALLKSAGAEVVMVRKEDTFMSLRARVEAANAAKTDATVSIHFNSSEWDHLLGIETYFYKEKDQLLARAIHKQMVQELQRPDKDMRQARFYELNHTEMPCVLVEPAYLSNYWEEMLIRNESFRQKVAHAIMKGLEDYFRDN
jgi:N-acetylmuramoyl-L-alanine amidase